MTNEWCDLDSRKSIQEKVKEFKVHEKTYYGKY